MLNKHNFGATEVTSIIPSGRKKVLVSVLNYNSIQDAIETIKCLECQTYDNYDLELVDNASTNNCVSEINTRMPHIKIIRNPENTGYAGGINKILRRGFLEGYEFIIICNSDIEVDKDSIAKMISTAETHEDAGLVGGIDKCYFSGKIRAVGGRGFSIWRSRPNWLTKSDPKHSETRFDYVQGAMVLFTKKALSSGLIMDESLFMYYEEIDLGYKLKQQGLYAYTVNNLYVRHKSQQRFLDINSGYYQQRNRVYLVKKYGKFYHFIFHILYLTIFELPIKVILRSSQGHSKYSLACVIGFIHGIFGRMGKWR